MSQDRSKERLSEFNENELNSIPTFVGCNESGSQGQIHNTSSKNMKQISKKQ